MCKHDVTAAGPRATSVTGSPCSSLGLEQRLDFGMFCFHVKITPWQARAQVIKDPGGGSPGLVTFEHIYECVYS